MRRAAAFHSASDPTRPSAVAGLYARRRGPAAQVRAREEGVSDQRVYFVGLGAICCFYRTPRTKLSLACHSHGQTQLLGEMWLLSLSLLILML